MRRDHSARVALRTAAVEWACAVVTPPVDALDRAFKRMDNKLMRAATRYVKTMERQRRK